MINSTRHLERRGLIQEAVSKLELVWRALTTVTG